MQLGISTYAYTWAIGVPGQFPDKPLTASGLIDKAVQLGLPCIQIADNLPLHLFSLSQITELANYADRNKIEVEIGTRGLTVQNLERYIEIARNFRSPILRMVIDAQDYKPTLQEVIDLINDNMNIFEQSGIRLALENHDRFKSSEFAQIVNQTNPQWVGICLDSVNSLGAGEGIEEVVKTLAPFTINLHLKQFTIRRSWHNMGFQVEGAPFGNGFLDISWLLSNIAQQGNCHSAILEMWTPPEEQPELTIAKEAQWVIESIRYLKPFFPS